MNVEDALKKIGKITEKALEKNPDALTWDDEINIKRSMVNSLNLEKRKEMIGCLSNSAKS